MLIAIIYLLLAAGLARWLIKSDRGTRAPEPALWAAFGFGLLAIPLVFLIELPFLINGSLGRLAESNLPILQIVLLCLIVGLAEEVGKFLPLAIFIRHKNYFNEHTDGLIYFGLAGLGFGLLENLQYTQIYGAKIGLIRIVIPLFLHPAASGIIGYYFAKAKVEHQNLTQTGLALLTMVGLHALYDFGLFSRRPVWMVLSLIITILLNVGLFWYYRKATKKDQAYGLAATGHNQYCRRCGKPNQAKTLYCEFCGQKT